MQTSITRFFKSKAPSESVGTINGASDDRPTSETVPDSTSNAITGKRVAEDDEVNENQVKRQAISSPLSTPVKGGQNSQAGGDKLEPKSAILTPPKPKLVQESKTAVPVSPLIDLSVVIRKKISNGSFALHENIGSSWFKALQAEFDKPYFKKLSSFVQQERKQKTVFPPEDKVYSWTHHHAIRDTRVVILGQDPYHGHGQAHGLSFSVQRGVRLPPSLINIFKELESDIAGFKSPSCGDLTGWSKQGVLMLNTCLTVNQGQANSHQGKGWETFTDAVISWISKNLNHKAVFMFWGRPAQRKSGMIDKRHKVLTAAHPSPLSAHNGFFGCKHFSQTNVFLRSQKLPEIDWKAL